jgi:hypothetical protein
MLENFGIKNGTASIPNASKSATAPLSGMPMLDDGDVSSNAGNSVTNELTTSGRTSAMAEHVTSAAKINRLWMVLILLANSVIEQQVVIVGQKQQVVFALQIQLGRILLCEFRS